MSRLFYFTFSLFFRKQIENINKELEVERLNRIILEEKMKILQNEKDVLDTDLRKALQSLDKENLDKASFMNKVIGYL